MLLRDAFGLISSQGIHRINQDCLDTALPFLDLLAAVLKERQQETLGFA